MLFTLLLISLIFIILEPIDNKPNIEYIYIDDIQLGPNEEITNVEILEPEGD